MSKSATPSESASLSAESSSEFIWLSTVSGTVVTRVLARPSLSMVKVREVRCLEPGRSDDDCQEVRESGLSGGERTPLENRLVTLSATDTGSAKETWLCWRRWKVFSPVPESVRLLLRPGRPSMVGDAG